MGKFILSCLVFKLLIVLVKNGRVLYKIIGEVRIKFI